MGEAKSPLRSCTPPHSKFPQTAAEWAEVLALQKQFHSVEVHKWRQILRASVELLDEVRPGTVGPGTHTHHLADASGPQFPPPSNEEAVHSPQLLRSPKKSAEWKNRIYWLSSWVQPLNGSKNWSLLPYFDLLAAQVRLGFGHPLPQHDQVVPAALS